MCSNKNHTEFNHTFPFRALNTAYTPRSFSQRHRPRRPQTLDLVSGRPVDRAIHVPPTISSASLPEANTTVLNLALPFRSPGVAYVPRGFSHCYRRRRPWPMNFTWTRRYQKPATLSILVPMSGTPRSPDESKFLGPLIARPVTRRMNRRLSPQRPAPPIPPRAAARLSQPEIRRVNASVQKPEPAMVQEPEAPTVTAITKTPRSPRPERQPRQRHVEHWSREAFLEDIWFAFASLALLLATFLVMNLWLVVTSSLLESIIPAPRVDEAMLRRRY